MGKAAGLGVHRGGLRQGRRQACMSSKLESSKLKLGERPGCSRPEHHSASVVTKLLPQAWPWYRLYSRVPGSLLMAADLWKGFCYSEAK